MGERVGVISVGCDTKCYSSNQEHTYSYTTMEYISTSWSIVDILDLYLDLELYIDIDIDLDIDI